MKNLFSFLLLFLSGILWSQPGGNCPNADFSMNGFQNWVGGIGNCCPIVITNPNTIQNGRHTIMTPGLDPIVPTLTRTPPGIPQSARLGNSQVGAQAESLTYSFVVTNQNALFIYRYAVVLEDPGHPPIAQPRFEMQVKNQNGGIIPCTFYQVAAGGNVPGFINYQNVRWRDWTTTGVNLLNYVGQVVTIEARTGDCDYSGHFGYAYIAAECRPLQIDITYCVGDTVATLVAPPGFIGYQWSNGATTQQISIINPTWGQNVYQVTLTSATGCTAQLSANINPVLPTAHFNWQSLCNGEIQFTDSTVIPGVQPAVWNWSFGDGGQSSFPNPTHTYQNPGPYNVTLISSAQVGCEDTVTLPIVVPPIPYANFNIDTLCGLTKNFTDQSTIANPGGIVSWFWDFGDGSTDTIQNPSHTYNSPGNFNVTLIITDSVGCSDTITKPAIINSIPQASFITQNVCAGQNMPFQNTSNIFGGGLMNHSWNFGNGATSVQTSPWYQYPNPGTYTVTLIVTGPGGCKDTATQQVTVNPIPVAAFTLPNTCGLSDTITNTSTVLPPSQIISYQWNLGNGQTSNQQNPTYNYNNPGVYNITLTVTSTGGCTDSETQPLTINSIPVASFTAPQTCHGNAVPFTNTSTILGNANLNYQWSFGDGNTSTQTNPTQMYTNPGQYLVTLIATGPGLCSDTVTQIVNVPPTPIASFVVPDSCGLTGQMSSFSVITPPGFITSYQWDLGNGQTFNQPNINYNYNGPGVYNVTLVVSSNQGCSDTITQPVTIWSIPTAQFTHTPTCYGIPFNFTDQSTITNSQIIGWSWSLGNGQTSNQQNPSHFYNTNGQYPVQLIVTGQGGCTDTITDVITVYPKPTAAFVLPDSCGMSAAFTDLSLFNITSWNWNFGDGNTSNQTNPTHIYQTNGTYQVQLIVQNTNGCLDTLVQEYRNYHIPIADIITANNCLTYSTVVLDNSTVQNSQISTWNWNVNNINQTSQNFNNTFTSSGVYQVNLVVTSVDGCIDSTSGQFEVYPLPFVSFISPDECAGDSVNFTNLSIGATTYQWYLNGNLFSTSTNPKNAYSWGQYQIQLIGTNQYLCQDSLSQLLTIYPRPIPSFGGQFEGCIPLQVFLDNQTTIANNGTISSYIWNIGVNTYYTEDINLTYGSVGNYSVSLTAISDKGCDSTISFIDVIKTYPLPNADFAYSPENPTTANTKVEFTNLSQGNLYNTWEVMSQTFTETHISHTFPADTGKYLIYLHVENEYGCTDSIYHPLYINANFTVFIPNSFTPTRDGLNDSFKVYGTGIVEAEMLIFNRWGELLSSYKNLEPMTKGWDGKNNRQPVKQDVYVYKIKVRDFTGEWHDFTGQVNLLK
jgi:gliding motility-associated-like protein